MELKDLQYFKDRFLALNIEMIEAKELLKLVDTAISNFEKMENNGNLFHAFFNDVWGLLSEIADNVEEINFQAIKAMEAEFAGHTLFYRLEQGWLTRQENAPTDFDYFNDILKNEGSNIILNNSISIFK
ncbi:hypothetical protein GHT89_16475 [Acinetobacter baumannii]|uniref:hypothetical protein n=1 Tax=Acinetobacter baumannii TaxID=470 RepID=UPI00387DCD45